MSRSRAHGVRSVSRVGLFVLSCFAGVLGPGCGDPPDRGGGNPITPVLPPADDHGDTRGAATAIGATSSTPGVLETDGDVDFFRLEVPSGGGLLRVGTSGGTDTVGTLHFPDGSSTQNDNAVDENFSIVTNVVAAGTYYVEVRGWCGSSGCETGSYVLNTALETTASDDHGNTRQTATRIGLSSSTAGVLESDGDVDYFRLEVPSSAGPGTITITTTGDTDTVGALHLLDGTRLTNDDASSTQNYHEQNFRIVADVTPGIYFVTVGGWCGDDGCETGAYVLHVIWSSAAAADDHGDTLATATPIGIVSSAAGALESEGDIDFFRLETPSEGVLTVTTTGDTDTVGQLIFPDGTHLFDDDSGTGLNFSIEARTVAGVHYISVAGWCEFYGCETGEYFLHISWSPAARTTAAHTVLEALYRATDGPNWTDNTGWLTDRPLRDWYGVETDTGGRVLTLSLEENELDGTIPPEIGGLTSLTFLRLSANRLRGGIPPEIGNLTNLTYLSLRLNQLAGRIPPELGQLTNLTRLRLYRNQLTGPIPAALGDLSNLTELSLNVNQLSGRIPPELGQLTRLEWLSLGGNQLSGPIPPELGQLTNLSVLRLGFNPSLSGPLPDTFPSLTALEELSLEGTGVCVPTGRAFTSWLARIREKPGVRNCGTTADRATLDNVMNGPNQANRSGWLSSRGLGNGYPVTRARFEAGDAGRTGWDVVGDGKPSLTGPDRWRYRGPR